MTVANEYWHFSERFMYKIVGNFLALNKICTEFNKNLNVQNVNSL